MNFCVSTNQPDTFRRPRWLLYHHAIKKKGYKHCLYKTVIEQVEQNSMYSQIPQIPSIALGGYYHDVIKQQVNKYDELRKGISNN